MGLKCSICTHKARLEIDREIVNGKSLQSISRQFVVSSAAISHHSRAHLSHQLVRAYEQKELEESMNLLGRIDTILHHAENIFERNYAARHDVTALKALDSQRQTIDLLARISMFLHQAKAAELQAAQGDREAQRQAEAEDLASLMADRLTPAELELFEQLSARVRGEIDKPIIPDTTPIFPKPKATRAMPAAEPDPDSIPDQRMKRTKPPILEITPVPIPDGHDLPRSRRNPFADETRFVTPRNPYDYSQ